MTDQKKDSDDPFLKGMVMGGLWFDNQLNDFKKSISKLKKWLISKFK